jgi:hypothetical protein
LVKKYDIAFVESASSITEPVTKLGGQPVWIEAPQWPLSRETGGQRQFLCQVALDADLFDVPPGKVAYLFMTGGAEGEYVNGTWDPEAGENAVIVQPSSEAPYDGRVETVPSPTGPTLYRFEGAPDGAQREAVPCEYAARLTPGEEADPASEDERASWDDEIYDAYFDSLAGNKVGGTPGFIQAEEYPEGGPWNLLLQLEMMELPCYVNFGDAGVGYTFVSTDGKKGRFLWQCH